MYIYIYIVCVVHVVCVMHVVCVVPVLLLCIILFCFKGMYDFYIFRFFIFHYSSVVVLYYNTA